MFKIGKLNIKNRIIAAPMAGVTDRAFRDMARSFGAGLVFTEMISAMGLLYGAKSRQMADTREEEQPVAIQIFGSDPEPMARGARILQDLGAALIDINMGCPTAKIVKNGEGAALLKSPARSREIIRAVVRAVELPVSVKLRKGWNEDSINCIEIAGIAEQEGVQAVTLHPRSREQFFSGLADWDMIKQLKKALTIPVIGNGDIWNADDALRMLEYTGCDAVMIGRAAMGNPFIFREATALIEKGMKTAPAGMEERVSTAIKHLEMACLYKGEKVAVREMRKHFSWYIKNSRGAARIRGKINSSQTRHELIASITRVPGT